MTKNGPKKRKENKTLVSITVPRQIHVEGVCEMQHDSYHTHELKRLWGESVAFGCAVLEQWLGFDVEIALPRVAVIWSIWTAQLYCSSASTSFAVMGRGAYSLHAPLMVRLTTDYSVLGISLSLSRRFPFDYLLTSHLRFFFAQKTHFVHR